MSDDRTDAITEPNDLTAADAAPDTSDEQAEQEQVQTDDAAPEAAEQAQEQAAAPAPTREEVDARLAAIEQGIAEADAAIKAATARMESLRRERDALNRQRAPQAAMSQAEAHAAIVASGQAQRAARAEQAKQFQTLTGGTIPTVETPAERVLKARPRTA